MAQSVLKGFNLHFLNNNKKKIYTWLLVGDYIVIAFSILLAYCAKIALGGDGNIVDGIWERVSLFHGSIPAIHILVFYVFLLYEEEHLGLARSLPKLLAALLLSSLLLASLLFFLHRDFFVFGRTVFIVHILLAPFLLLFWRRSFKKLLYGNLVQNKNVLVVGVDASVTMLLRDIKTYERHGFHIAGIYGKGEEGMLPYDWDGSLYEKGEDLDALVEREKIRTIVVASHAKISQSVINKILDLKFHGVEVINLPTFYQMVTGKMPINHVKEFWLLFYDNRSFQFHPIYGKVKRLSDLLLSISLLILFAPFFVIVPLVIKFSSKGSVFFVQERLGLRQKPFKLIKYRTMVDGAESATGPTWSKEGDPRVTAVGRFLRKSRLDEIPQLINVIKGDMSFVGPRPIRKHFADMLAESTPYYNLRFMVKPGLTGWAQVVFPCYAATVEGQKEKTEFDLFYVKNQSHLMDMVVFLKTIQLLFFRKMRY